MPPIDQGISPSFYFESDEDNQLPNGVTENEIEVDSLDMKYLFGLYFKKDGNVVYDDNEIHEFYTRINYDEYFIAPAYHEKYKYMSEKIFCFINFQSLSYKHIAFKKLEKYTLKQVEVILREEIENE